MSYGERLSELAAHPSPSTVRLIGDGYSSGVRKDIRGHSARLVCESQDMALLNSGNIPSSNYYYVVSLGP
ncbi:hypothetical protein E4U61_004920 [Claviceps capensis]|nr:hypothetical protein E4U61_004920 [Claviceps capensis]